MRILFVTSLHHPDVLAKAVAQTPAGQEPPLFPPSMAQHWWDRALRRRGHQTAVFFRNQPAFGNVRAHRHSERLTPGKIVTGVMNRLPPEANPDYQIRNQRLIEQARAFQPDTLWLTGDNLVIYPDTLAQIKRETNCKIIYSTGTSPIVFSKPIERRAARLYDLVLVNDYYHGIQWLELGARHMECLPLSACAPEFHHPYTLTDEQRKAYTCDIAFGGTLVPSNLYSLRTEALAALMDFDLGIWSVHGLPEALKPLRRGDALGQDMLEVLSAAKMTINTHGDFMRYGGNMRLFEAAGVGVLQIADDLPGTRQWFTDGETIVLYRDLDDLRQKVAYYLAHDAEREAVVRRAQEHVYQHHTYDQRMARVETLLSDC
jgi:hypothetical protein